MFKFAAALTSLFTSVSPFSPQGSDLAVQIQDHKVEAVYHTQIHGADRYLVSFAHSIGTSYNNGFLNETLFWGTANQLQQMQQRGGGTENGAITDFGIVDSEAENPIRFEALKENRDILRNEKSGLELTRIDNRPGFKLRDIFKNTAILPLDTERKVIGSFRMRNEQVIIMDSAVPSNGSTRFFMGFAGVMREQEVQSSESLKNGGERFVKLKDGSELWTPSAFDLDAEPYFQHPDGTREILTIIQLQPHLIAALGIPGLTGQPPRRISPVSELRYSAKGACAAFKGQ